MLGPTRSAYRSGMKQTRRIASSAWRRVLVRECVRTTGVFLFAGGAIGAGGALAARLLWASDSVTAWYALGAGVGAGAIAGLAIGWRRARRIGVSGAAIEVDHALRLSDRLTSALTFDPREDDAFVSLAQSDAERVAAGARTRRAIRVRFGGWWLAWPVIVGVGVGVGLWVPAVSLLDRAAERERLRQVALQQDRLEAAKDVEAARQALLGASPEENSPVSPDDLRALEEIARELEQGDVAGDEGRALAAAALEDMAREREALEQRAQDQIDEIASRVAGASRDEQRGGKAGELRDALARGDMEAAAKALEALEEPGALSQDEMLEMARELEELADAIDAAGEGSEQSDAEQSGSEQSGGEQSSGDGQQDQAAKELSKSLQEAANEVNEQCKGGGESGKSGKSNGSQNSSGSKSTIGGPREGSASSGQQGKGDGKSPTSSPQGQAGPAGKGGERANRDAIRNARETLQRMGKQQSGAKKADQQVKNLRGAAQQLMGSCDNPGDSSGSSQTKHGDGMSMSGQGAGNGSFGMLTRDPVERPFDRVDELDGRTEPVENAGSARSFEWYNPNTREGRGTIDRRVAAERLREAAKSAERAIEDQTVPSKYSRLLREYYRRMPDAVKPAGDAPPAEAPPSEPEPKPTP